MSMLYFQSRFHSFELNSLDLPVEIRKPDLSLAAHSVLSRPVELAPGTYYVSTRLPAGQQLYETVKVEKDKDAIVTLTPDPEDASAHEWLEVQHYILGPSDLSLRDTSLEGLVSPLPDSQAQRFTPSEEAGGGEPANTPRSQAWIRGFLGNVLLGDHLVRGDQNWFSLTQLTTVNYLACEVFAGDTKLVQLLQSGAPAINIMLPIWQQQGCQLCLIRQPNGLYTLDANLVHSGANTLLRYMQKGFLEQASTMASSPSLSAEQLLYRKMEEPIAAAVGAYVLLRLGDLERLHHWTENLLNFFGWLPDGITIRAEHLARLGNHEEALSLLLTLPSRGLPIFSDGLSYALDRLGLYIRVGEKNFEKTRLDQAKILLERLQQFAAFVDFSKPLLTFTGIDPGEPNDVAIGEDIPPYGTLSVLL